MDTDAPLANRNVITLSRPCRAAWWRPVSPVASRSLILNVLISDSSCDRSARLTAAWIGKGSPFNNASRGTFQRSINLAIEPFLWLRDAIVLASERSSAQPLAVNWVFIASSNSLILLIFPLSTAKCNEEYPSLSVIIGSACPSSRIRATISEWPYQLA